VSSNLNMNTQNLGSTSLQIVLVISQVTYILRKMLEIRTPVSCMQSFLQLGNEMSGINVL
jgi:hypothetical protein